jgi:hypothetical protein
MVSLLPKPFCPAGYNQKPIGCGSRANPCVSMYMYVCINNIRTYTATMTAGFAATMAAVVAGKLSTSQQQKVIAVKYEKNHESICLM